MRAVDRKRNDHQLDVDQGAVSAPTLSDPLRAAPRQRLARDLAPVFAVEPARAEDELVDRPADCLFRGVAKELGRSRVPVGHDLLGVHDHDRSRADRNERLEVLALPFHLCEQTRVLDRGADVGRDRREQPRVRLAEAPFLIDALDADDTDRGVPQEDRHAEVRERGCPDDWLFLVLLSSILQQRLA